MASKGNLQYTIMQYEKNPKTGEDLHFSEKNILDAMEFKTIKKCTYVRHDKDVKTDKTNSHPDAKIGDPIPPHWHIAIYCKSAVEIHTLSKWFGVPANFINIVYGQNAYIDSVEYLTHEHPKQQEMGKYRYPDDEIKSNHDWRSELDLYQIRRARKGASGYNTKDYYRNEVMYKGMSLRQVIDEDADAYRNDWQTLDKMRLKYIQQFAPLPTTRMNYYVEGRGGVGKGLISKAIARNLYPDLKNDDDIYFEVGAENATFEGYDGQPVIIWNDFRAYDLLSLLKGRNNVFNVFETHPTRQRQNVKFSSIRLTNTVNIVNSVQPFSEFLDGLAGEFKDRTGVLHRSEDKGQAYRRFPMITILHESDFDILLNKGVLDGDKNYLQFVEHKHIQGNLERINRRLNNYQNEKLAIESKVVAPIVDGHTKLYTSLSGGDNTDSLDDILNEFTDYGTQDLNAINQDEIQKEAEEESHFIKNQEYEIQKILYTGYPDRNDPKVQAALIAEQALRNDPHRFAQNPQLHLPISQFSGAYIF